MTDTFRPPPALDLTDTNVAESFRKWKRQMEVYMMANGSTSKSKEVQCAIILHCAGPQMIEVFDHFEFDAEADKKDPEKIIQKMEDYCSPRQNVVLHTYRFWMAPLTEPFDSFLTDLRTKAESCDFGELKDRMIRDKIIFTVSGKLQELLLRESEKLDLAKATEICRAHEVSQKQSREISGKASAGIAAGGTQKINKVFAPHSHKQKKKQFQKKPPDSSQDRLDKISTKTQQQDPLTI
jgi:hypothetical protein